MFTRKPYSGPVFFADDGFHYTARRWRRKRLIVTPDGSFVYARRSDPSHQSRFHRRFAEVIPS